ncbi:Coiled-coil domain-containing protein 58 [Frankliniella fusca]|uniref:Protein MIX23 n=1 Tax=Frankliniella fusca TaxID=407009 RepID=A0AAE1L9E2_9NEOP|nr:Coiled-coil domain-containing protein 58 [Frankliniella fusca]
MDLTQRVECADFQLFQANLKLMREIDDKIINTMNSKLPTNFSRAEVDPTATCKELFAELTSTYSQRERVIKGCISVSADRIKHLSGAKDKDPNNITVMKDLRREQTKLRMLQSELSVEEVVKERSLKVFHERCRSFLL